MVKTVIVRALVSFAFLALVGDDIRLRLDLKTAEDIARRATKTAEQTHGVNTKLFVALDQCHTLNEDVFVMGKTHIESLFAPETKKLRKRQKAWEYRVANGIGVTPNIGAVNSPPTGETK